MMIYCSDERLQQKNKIKAMKVLRSRLLKQKEDEERAKYAQNRKDQSEYVQITPHKIDILIIG